MIKKFLLAIWNLISDPFGHYRAVYKEIENKKAELQLWHDQIMATFKEIKIAVDKKDWDKYGELRLTLIEAQNRYQEISNKKMSFEK